MASSERVFQLLDTPEDIVDPPEPYAPARLEGRVAFPRTSGSSYGAGDAQRGGEAAPRADDADDWVLRDVSFDVAPGEVVAIVGHTGAGKSTLASLLNRLYDVQRGTVLVDGVDVRAYAQAALRRRIGVVLQDVFLFSGSIERNIRLEDEDMGPRLDAPVCRIRQRRPLYRKPARRLRLRSGRARLQPLDRPAPAHRLRPHPRAQTRHPPARRGHRQHRQPKPRASSRDAIARILHPGQGRQRTCIVIAHRLSTVRHAGRILVMHHGRLCEQGTHDELIARGGRYRTLYELQYQNG